MKYANAEAERAAAERLIAESLRAIDDTNKTKIMVQQDVNKKLEQRLTDVKFWEKEGDDYLATIKGETGALVELVKRIDKAIDNYREALHIAQQCLVSRAKRRGIDLVHDIAEMELLKEVEVCQGVLALLSRAKEEASEQLRLNRQTQYNLEKDLKHKMITIGIDNYCHELSETCRGNQLGNGVTQISPLSASADDWLNFATANISAAEKTRQNSVWYLN